MHLSDKTLAGQLRKAIGEVAALMTEAKKRQIIVTFNIAEVTLPDAEPRFEPTMDIKRVVPL